MKNGDRPAMPKKTLKQKASELEETMRCNCDLDNWQPEHSTGHSLVCRIHKAAKAAREQEQ